MPLGQRLADMSPEGRLSIFDLLGKAVVARLLGRKP
jgi:hypothetical protein